jgi:hypothetical protein
MFRLQEGLLNDNQTFLLEKPFAFGQSDQLTNNQME